LIIQHIDEFSGKTRRLQIYKGEYFYVTKIERLLKRFGFENKGLFPT